MSIESQLRDPASPVWADEPPLALTAHGIREQAAAGRRRKRAVGLVAACVLVLVGLGVHPFVPGLPPGNDADQERVGDRGELLSADELASAIRDIGLRHAPAEADKPPNVSVEALDSQSTPIEGADRDRASMWLGIFSYGPGNVVEIRLIHEGGSTVAQQSEVCSQQLATGWSMECEVHELGDGSIVLEQVRGVRRQVGAWPVVPTKEFDRVGRRLWFQNLTRHYHPGGGVTVVTEFVNASSLPEARTKFSLDPAASRAIAGDPALRFPVPPKGDNGCGWTVEAKRNLIRCQVAVEAVLSTSSDDMPQTTKATGLLDSVSVSHSGGSFSS